MKRSRQPAFFSPAFFEKAAALHSPDRHGNGAAARCRRGEEVHLKRLTNLQPSRANDLKHPNIVQIKERHRRNCERPWTRFSSSEKSLASKTNVYCMVQIFFWFRIFVDVSEVFLSNGIPLWEVAIGLHCRRGRCPTEWLVEGNSGTRERQVAASYCRRIVHNLFSLMRQAVKSKH